jgi:hypothetical protein
MLMTVAGIIMAGFTYMDMRRERHLHDRLAGMKFRLAEQTDWHMETFSPRDTGYHALHLSTVNTSRTAPVSDTTGEFRTFYHGAFDARIVDPTNDIIWSRHIEGNTIFLALPSNTAWIFIDSVHIQNVREGAWKLQARVMESDENFSNTFSELIVMPPRAENIGLYIYTQSIKLIGMGILILAGFCTMVLGGYLWRRATLSSQ